MLVLFIVFGTIAGLASSQSSTIMTSPSTSPTTVDTWPDLGVMAIRAITELSRVCIVASRREYTLDTSRPYTYIKYPSSYRATLTQATDIVDGALRTTQMSISRVQMTMGQVPEQLNTALTLLFDATIEERQIFLPSTLENIVRMSKDAASTVGKVSAELEQGAAFFNELLRAVQPSPPPLTTPGPSGSSSTQANKSPLDIDHATALTNILVHFKSLIAIWNQVAQQFSKLALQATGAAKFMNDRNTFLWTLGDMDETANLLSTLVSFYSEVSMKAITPQSSRMGGYLILQSEEERLAEVQKVNERADHNIPRVQQLFAQAMVDHEMHNKERNEQYDRLAATPSK